MIGPMSGEPVRHLFTVEEYEGMGDLFAPDQRLELLGGEIIEMAPIGSPHASVVNRLNRLFVVALGDAAVVAVQNPLRLSDLSEPQPDLALLVPRADFYASGHPRPDDVGLVIEVSDSTARWDRTVKRPYYAAAGIAEMWIVDLGARVVEVATDPGPDGYRQVRRVGPGGQVAPLAFPGVTIDAADLLG